MTGKAAWRNTILVSLTLLLPRALPAEPEEAAAPPPLADRAIARNDYFEVIADDRLSAQFAASAGELMARRFSRVLPMVGSVQKPVVVDLVPLERYRERARFVTKIYPSGQVNVVVAWSGSTTKTDLERALAQGHLTRLAAAYAPEQIVVPLWLELALQHLARGETVAAHRESLAEKVKGNPSVSLRTVLSAERGSEDEAERLGPYAYWLLRFLERESRQRDQLANYLVRLFRGEPPLRAMNAVYGGALRSMADAEMWWLVGLNELIRERGSPAWSPERTRQRLDELSRFTFQVEGKPTRLFADDLWEHRASETLRSELQYRIRVMAVERGTFHAFYHNALFSLNALFQATLEADEERWRESLVTFRHDLRAGDELTEDMRRVLDDLQAELQSPSRE